MKKLFIISGLYIFFTVLFGGIKYHFFKLDTEDLTINIETLLQMPAPDSKYPGLSVAEYNMLTAEPLFLYRLKECAKEDINTIKCNPHPHKEDIFDKATKPRIFPLRVKKGRHGKKVRLDRYYRVTDDFGGHIEIGAPEDVYDLGIDLIEDGDFQAGIEFLEMSARAGSPRARFALGSLYDGAYDYPNLDKKQAYIWYASTNAILVSEGRGKKFIEATARAEFLKEELIAEGQDIPVKLIRQMKLRDKISPEEYLDYRIVRSKVSKCHWRGDRCLKT